jgi:hypothetical protein
VQQAVKRMRGLAYATIQLIPFCLYPAGYALVFAATDALAFAPAVLKVRGVKNAGRGGLSMLYPRRYVHAQEGSRMTIAQPGGHVSTGF